MTGFRFVSAHVGEFPVKRMCDVVGVNRSGFYQWRNTVRSDRQVRDQELLSMISDVYEVSRRTYGAPRVHGQLQRRGVRVGRKRVARIMSQAGLVGVSNPRRRRYQTTELSSDRDLVHRDFTSGVVDGLWVADMTRFTTREGHSHLACVLDVHTGRIVGWSLSRRRTAGLVAAAAQMAHGKKLPGSAPIHHSDQGAEYTALVFTDMLEDWGVRTSLGSVGNCYDNALIESFWATLKRELAWIHGTIAFGSHQELRAAVFDYIEVFYNNERHQKKLGNLTPNEYYQKVMAA